MLPLRRLVCVPGWLLVATLAGAGTVPIDEFSDPLPPNPLLPNSGQRVLFVGYACDGAACPPGPEVGGGNEPARNNSVSQPALAGVLDRGTRRIELHNSADYRFPSLAAVASDPPGVSVSFRWPLELWLELAYTGPDVRPWNLDLRALGATGIRLSIDRGGAPGPPVHCFLVLVDHDSESRTLESHAILDESGEVLFPLTNLPPPDAGFPQSSVDAIHLLLGVCPEECGGPADVALQFSVRGFDIVTDDTTPARPTTWGRLKSAHP